MKQSLPTLFITLLFTSCNLGLNHKQKDAANYLEKIEQLENSILPSSKKLTSCLEYVEPIASADNNFQLSSKEIDSLSACYKNMIYSIDSAVRILDKLGEFDKSFNITRREIRYLQIMRRAYTNTLPIYLAVHKIGWNAASPAQQNTINHGSEILTNGENEAKKERLLKNDEIGGFKLKHGLF